MFRDGRCSAFHDGAFCDVSHDGRCRCLVGPGHTAAAQAYADQDRNVVICSPFYLNQLLPGDILEREITPADLLVDRWRGVHTVDITAGLSASEKLKVLGEYDHV